MPPITQTDKITFTLDGIDRTCQVLSGFEFEPGGPGSGDTLETACPDTPVLTETGQWENGYLRGDVLVDSTADIGMLRDLHTARQDGQPIDFVFTSWEGTSQMTWTGKCIVQSIPVRFTRQGATSRMTIDLLVDGKTTLT